MCIDFSAYRFATTDSAAIEQLKEYGYIEEVEGAVGLQINEAVVVNADTGNILAGAQIVACHNLDPVRPGE